MNKNNFAIVATALCGFVGLSAAHGAPITSQQCGSVTDTRTISIDPGVACIAEGIGNNSNDPVFEAAVSGMALIGHEETGVSASAFDVTLDAAAGTLQFNTNLWDLYSEIWVLLKVGAANGRGYDPDWALFSIESGYTAYNWSVAPTQGGALSHAALYGRPTSVPEPSTLGLIGLGVLAMGLRRRRR